jgi:hypothetical protein
LIPPEGWPEPGRSVEECPHCHKTVDMLLANYREMKVVTCPLCKEQSVPHQSEDDLGVKVWRLIPLTEDSRPNSTGTP